MANEARVPRWETWAMTCTELLVSVLASDIESDGLWESPAEAHEFVPGGQFV
jgi:hypothetical protein